MRESPNGVHGKKVDLNLELLWERNITITTRLVDTVSTPMPLKTFWAHRPQPKESITHRFPFAKILDAYDAFANAATSHALQITIEAQEILLTGVRHTQNR